MPGFRSLPPAPPLPSLLLAYLTSCLLRFCFFFVGLFACFCFPQLGIGPRASHTLVKYFTIEVQGKPLSFFSFTFSGGCGKANWEPLDLVQRRSITNGANVTRDGKMWRGAVVRPILPREQNSLPSTSSLYLLKCLQRVKRESPFQYCPSLRIKLRLQVQPFSIKGCLLTGQSSPGTFMNVLLETFSWLCAPRPSCFVGCQLALVLGIFFSSWVLCLALPLLFNYS